MGARQRASPAPPRTWRSLGTEASLWRISRTLNASQAVTERLIARIRQPALALVGERDPELGGYGPRFARDLPTPGC